MRARVQRQRRWSISILTGAAILSTLGATASAGDGVKLLKQPATFPLTISTPGSYRLKGNFVLPDENTIGIDIVADNVSLDLNGFSIIGPVTCSGTCTPSGGTGYGIYSLSQNLRISNGMISGAGSIGVYAQNGRVERLTVSNNGSHGILAYDVVNSVVSHNGGSGVVALGLVTGNTIADNNGSGVGALTTSVLVTNNVIRGNGGIGIAAGGYGSNALTFNSGTAAPAAIEIDGNVCDGDTTCP